MKINSFLKLHFPSAESFLIFGDLRVHFLIKCFFLINTFKVN